MTITFRSSVVGGTTLVRDAINSPNYVTGSTGWTINADGTSEFGEAVIRGLLRVNAAVGDAFLEIFASGDTVNIDTQPGSTGLVNPVFQGSRYTDTDTVNQEISIRDDGPVFTPFEKTTWQIGASDANGAFARLFTTLFTITGLTIFNDAVTVDDALTVNQLLTAFANMQVNGNLQVNNDATVNGQVMDSAGRDYYRGVRGTDSTNTGGAVAVVSAVINFPTAFPVGVIPDVHVNTTNTAATQSQWEGHAISVTNTGFRIVYHGPVLAAFNVNSYWNAFYPV